MKSRAFRRTRLAAAVGAALLSLSAGSAFGSAFALQEQNASGLGHAYAGGAAAAEDVSRRGNRHRGLHEDRLWGAADLARDPFGAPVGAVGRGLDIGRAVAAAGIMASVGAVVEDRGAGVIDADVDLWRAFHWS